MNQKALLKEEDVFWENTDHLATLLDMFQVEHR